MEDIEEKSENRNGEDEEKDILYFEDLMVLCY